MLSTPYVVAVTLIAAAIVAYAQYVFKRAVPKFSFNTKGLVSLFTNKNVLFGMFAYGVGLIFYLVALGSGQLSFVYPAFSTTFIFVILISHFKLGERIGYKRLAGVLFILLGIILTSGIIG